MSKAFFWAAMAVALIALPAMAQERGDRNVVDISGSKADSVFAAARQVQIEAQVADDIAAAGGVVTVTNSRLSDLFGVGGQIGIAATQADDVFLAGGSIDIVGTTVDDLYVAGGSLEIAGDIRDDLFAAGGRVHTRAETKVGGTGRIAGGDLNLEGRFANDLYLAGGTVKLDAEVAGSVEIVAGRIALGSGARIAGTLRYVAEDPPIVAQGAVVSGGIERMARPGRSKGPDMDKVVGGLILFALAVVSGICLIAMALQAIVPGLLSDSASRLGERPWESLGIGIAIVIVTPPALILSAITIVGLPVAILAGLLYFVFGVVAFAALAYGIGLWARARITGAPDEPLTWLWRTLWTLAGIAAMAVLVIVPFVGWAVAMLAIAAAIGALAAETRRALA